MNFQQFDSRFENSVQKVGPEFGEVHALRDQFIQANRGVYVPQPEVPLNIKGLIPKTGRLPATRNWYTRTSSFERNGFFNVHTHVFNTKWLYWSFLTLLVWGWVQPFMVGRQQEQENDNFEKRGVIYDKMSPRILPMNKIWSRPS